MQGKRPLTKDERELIASFLKPRDATWWLLGCYTGFRIQELLSITYGDVYRNGRVVDRLYIARKHIKGRSGGRSVYLSTQARELLNNYIVGHSGASHELLFPISRVQAHRILAAALEKAARRGVDISHVATHSMRKTFSNNIYEKSGKNIFLTQKALGHKSIDSTVSYLSYKTDEVDRLIEEI